MEVKEIKSAVDNLSDFVEVQNGIERLKNAVIDLAVRGLLTEQSESDGDAEDLYQEIQKDKDTIVSSKKKTKVLLSITAEEVPFKIPKNWKWVKLGDVSTYVQRGKGPKYTEFSKYPVLSQKCVRWHHIDWSKCKYIQEESLDKYEDVRFLKQGDLLLNSTGTGTIGRVAVFEDNPEYKKVVADSHVTVARFVSVSSRYIALWMSSEFIQHGLYNGKASGSTNQIEWNLATILNEVAPLPPLAEQKRIVERVDELMKLIDQLEVEKKERDEVRGKMVVSAFYSFGTEHNDFALKHLSELVKTPSDIDELEKSILSLAVSGKLTPQNQADGTAEDLYTKIQNTKEKSEKDNGKSKTYESISEQEIPLEIPENWKWVRLGEIATVKGGKRIPKGMSLLEAETKHPYLRVTDMKSQSINQYGLKYIDENVFNEISRYIISKDDVYVTIAGTIGAVGLIPDNLDGANLTENAAKITIFGGVSKEFIMNTIRSSYVQKQFLEKTLQMAQPKLALHRIESSVIALPPVAEQNRIIEKIDELMVSVQKLREVIGK